MQTTHIIPSPPRIPGSDPVSYDEAREWLQRQIRWEDRLDELHGLAARCPAAGPGTVRSHSGLLEQPGRSSGGSA